MWLNNQGPSSYVKIRHTNDKIFYQRPGESMRPKIREIQDLEGEREREKEVMKKGESYAQCGKLKFQERLSQF